MLDADAEGCIGRDRRGKDGIFEHLVVEELEGLAHGEVVARAATDKRHRPADDAVGAAHHLLLVATKAVGEEQEDLVVARSSVLGAGRGCRSSPAQVARGIACGLGRHRVAGATDRGDDHAGVAGAVGCDLASGGAADQRGGGRDAANAGEQCLEIVDGGDEDDEELGIGASKRRGGGFNAGLARGRVGGRADADPAVVSA